MSDSLPRVADPLPKRRALLDGALAVFASDGYSRATIDEIARTARVSSRTIYNQFSGKAELFHAVIVDSAEHVAAAQVEVAERHLGGIATTAELEDGLLAFGRVWATSDPRFVRHFDLVRQIEAEIGHVPVAAIQAWQDAGPRRVRGAIARHLDRLADAGVLRIDDADLAAAHLVGLATDEVHRRRRYGPSLSVAASRRMADAGVRTFLRGHRA